MTMKHLIASSLIVGSVLLGQAGTARAHGGTAVTHAVAEPKGITPEEVVALEKSGQHVVLGDVRLPVGYQRRHIRGAESLPVKDISTWAPKLPHKDLVVVYCACPHDEASTAVVRMLLASYKLTNVRFLKGGIDRWIGEGLPFDVD